MQPQCDCCGARPLIPFGSLGKEMARSQKIALSGLGIDKGLHSCSKIEKGGDSGGGAWALAGPDGRTKNRLRNPSRVPGGIQRTLMPQSPALVQACQDDCCSVKRLAHHHQQQGDQADRRKPDCFARGHGVIK